MTDAGDLSSAPGAYETPTPQRRVRLLDDLNSLTQHHAEACPAYRRILTATGWTGAPASSLTEVPFLPAQLFKRIRLASVPDTAVLRLLRSSGTSGQAPSQVVLDRATADRQARALGHIMREFFGLRRWPMVIVDEPARAERGGFTARGAGQLGFLPFGRDHFYLLRPDGSTDFAALGAWLEKHQADRVCFFGLTALVWEHLLAGPAATAGLRCAQPALLIHGGGWKKLTSRQVDPAAFKAAARALQITETRDYYGMVEQTGAIHVEDDDGPFVTPSCAEVIVRDPRTLAPVPDGETGLLQVLSPLSSSYPGHSILTEDLGRIVGIDDSPAGRHGTRFRVLGRLPASELRGCSDASVSSP